MKKSYRIYVQSLAVMALALFNTRADVFTWDGDTTTTWSDGNNWDLGTAPTFADDVLFTNNGYPNEPRVTANAQVNMLTLQDVATTLWINNANSLTNTGGFHGNGNLTLVGGGRLFLSNHSGSTWSGNLQVDRGTFEWRPTSGPNATIGSGMIILNGFATGIVQGAEIAVDTSGKPTGSGGADRSILNTIHVTALGGGINMGVGSGGNAAAIVYNNLELGGTLTMSSSNGGNADGYSFAGTVTLLQDVARTNRIINATGHNGSDWIAGQITDGGGGAGNALYLRVSGNNLQISDGTSDYAGGTVIEAGSGLVDVKSTARLGTGGLTVLRGGRVRLLNPTAYGDDGNLASGQTIALAAGGVVGVGVNVDISDRFTGDSAGVYGIDVVTHNYYLDQSALGNGRMFVGSLAGGTFAGTFGAGADSTYRLGGGTTAGSLQNFLVTAENALSGANNLIVGSGLNTSASYGRTIMLNSQDFSGAITINTDGFLVSRINGGTPWGDTANTIEVFGVLALTGVNGGPGGVLNTAYAPNITLRPGGALVIDHQNSFNNATAAVNDDRWDDATAIPTLHGAALTMQGNRSADASETVGAVVFNGNSFVNTRRTANNGQDVILTMASLAREGRGVLNISPGTSANLGADVNNASERFVFLDTTGLAIDNNMVAPWAIDRTANNFLQYDTSVGSTVAGELGLRPVTYTSTALLTAGALDIVNQSGGVALTTDVSVYALRYNDALNVSGGTWTIGLASGGIIGAGNNRTVNAILDSGSAELIFWAVGGTQNFANNAALRSSGGFIKAGASTLNLSNSAVAADYSITGGIVIQEGIVTSGSRFALALDDNLLTVNHAGRLNLNNVDTTILGLSGVGLSGDVYNGGANVRTLTINLAEGTETYEGRIQGSGSTAANLNLIKTGGGTQVFAQVSRLLYSGTTAVNEGALILDGSMATGSITVAAGALFGGSGTLATGSVTFADGTTLAPGSSPGTLTVDNLSLGSLTYLWELGATASDRVNVTGLLDLSLTPTITFALRNLDAVDPTGQTYVLFDAGGISGNFLYNFDAESANQFNTDGATVYQIGDQILLGGLTPVPEPATLALLGLGGVLAVWRRRKAR